MIKKTVKKSGLSAKEVIGIGAGVAALSAAAYMLFGPNGKKNQKALRGWAVKMKGEIIEKFEEAKKTLDPNVLSANYYQQPVDIEGRLYDGFEEWRTLPNSPKRYNTTDVADQGSDYLCSIDWFDIKTEDSVKVYITDIYYSNEKAEITEPKVAKMITADDITLADFESNNGGKGYARNVERELHALGNFKTVVQWTPQTANKEARILASSAWNSRNILMPPNWTSKYPEFAGEVLGYIAGGKNAHDDGVDVLATIYERVANIKPVEYWGIR